MCMSLPIFQDATIYKKESYKGGGKTFRPTLVVYYCYWFQLFDLYQYTHNYAVNNETCENICGDFVDDNNNDGSCPGILPMCERAERDGNLRSKQRAEDHCRAIKARNGYWPNDGWVYSCFAYKNAISNSSKCHITITVSVNCLTKPCLFLLHSLYFITTYLDWYTELVIEPENMFNPQPHPTVFIFFQTWQILIPEVES